MVVKSDTLERLLTEAEAPHSERLDGVVIGVLVGLSGATEPVVVYPGCPAEAGSRARLATPLALEDVGRQVALVFEDGDPHRPIVIGRLLNPGAVPAAKALPVAVEMDGKRLGFEAKEQIVLRCGQASIHLTKAGKVIIKGAYVSTRSSGVNRIKGASVEIN
jgi:hypothetical protein